jgi:hypothetical protein
MLLMARLYGSAFSMKVRKSFDDTEVTSKLCCGAMDGSALFTR